MSVSVDCLENLCNLILEELKLIRIDMKAEVRRLGHDITNLQVANHENDKKFSAIGSNFLNAYDIGNDITASLDKDLFYKQQIQQKNLKRNTVNSEYPVIGNKNVNLENSNTINLNKEMSTNSNKEFEICDTIESSKHLNCFDVDSLHVNAKETTDKVWSEAVISFDDVKPDLSYIIAEVESVPNNTVSCSDEDKTETVSLSNQQNTVGILVAEKDPDDKFYSFERDPKSQVGTSVEIPNQESNLIRTNMISSGEAQSRTKLDMELRHLKNTKCQLAQRKETCELCGKKFKKKCLKNHMLTHTDVKPYVCKICNKRFRINSTLKNHYLVHTGEKLFACEFCNRRFSRSGNLTRHQKTHTNERVYLSCTYCDRRFLHNISLKKHLKSHVGDKPYFCTTCDQRFALRDDLEQHSIRHVAIKR